MRPCGEKHPMRLPKPPQLVLKAWTLPGDGDPIANLKLVEDPQKTSSSS